MSREGSAGLRSMTRLRSSCSIPYAKGLADAESIKARGLAEAEAMEKKAVELFLM